jgi:hypothetical protein
VGALQHRRPLAAIANPFAVLENPAFARKCRFAKFPGRRANNRDNKI